MPKRTDLKKIMVIGAGPIVIGQACEFDYSGTQAVKALKEEGYQVILINSNPATIMTDPGLADRVYIEPITLPFLSKIIELERPDAILPTVGGQTALNAALELVDAGVLEKYNVELIGAKQEAILKAEDRKLFKEAMANIGVQVPKSGVAHNMQEANTLLQEIGLPVILRPSFTLGGAGGGVCYNEPEYRKMIANALAESPNSQVLIEQSVLGWKEFELEVMRDLADNVVIICSIENFDPMGIHTGDSITVAPQQTLTDAEYQALRNMSIDIIREIGVETGGSNIQFAINPENGEVIVIEMNPRVSRSSALASKATGFPIARIAAKLSVGYTLDEIPNDITQKTPASFEPTIDYVVTKIPRFTFEKFPESGNTLDTQMRSVGEAMAIGRNFPESFQKAIRSLETSRQGWGCDANIDISLLVAEQRNTNSEKQFIKEKLVKGSDERLFYIREALENGISIEEVNKLTYIDFWFLHQLNRILIFEKEFKANKAVLNDAASEQGQTLIRKAKTLGFSDTQLGYLLAYDKVTAMIAELAKLEKGSANYFAKQSEINSLIIEKQDYIYNYRINNNITPVFKRVDTCGAEFESFTPYLYGTYDEECEADISGKKKVIILGGGPNRIGQGIEFDYCCCHASYALQDQGIESIMVNSNPETVSTDYDTSDRLYFEPLIIEDILAICHKEMQKGELLGVILQFGGQTPLKLARELENYNIPVLGTSPASIDKAEDRELFSEMIHKLGLQHPDGGMASSLDQAYQEAEKVGYPILVRPSYVLGGRAMMIVHNRDQLKKYMMSSTEVTADKPVLIDKFLQNAIELDVDALCDGKDVYVAGILEHIEEAGVHSGDSACILPAKGLSDKVLDQVKLATRKMALELNVVGLINIQFAIQNEKLYVIEVNPRASRTVPFVSKASRQPLAKLATRIMLGATLKDLDLTSEPKYDLFYVKEVVLPFKKFQGVDTILGPEMKSTGEVMGIGRTPMEAFYKAQEASGQKLPLKGKVFVSINDASKQPLVESLKKLSLSEYKIIATQGTYDFLVKHGIAAEHVLKLHEGRPNIIDQIMSSEIDMIINIPTDIQTRNDALEIRLSSLRYNIPYMTTVAASIEAIKGMLHFKESDLEVYPM